MFLSYFSVNGNPVVSDGSFAPHTKLDVSWGAKCENSNGVFWKPDVPNDSGDVAPDARVVSNPIFQSVWRGHVPPHIFFDR